MPTPAEQVVDRELSPPRVGVPELAPPADGARNAIRR